MVKRDECKIALGLVLATISAVTEGEDEDGE